MPKVIVKSTEISTCLIDRVELQGLKQRAAVPNLLVAVPLSGQKKIVYAPLRRGLKILRFSLGVWANAGVIEPSRESNSLSKQPGLGLVDANVGEEIVAADMFYPCPKPFADTRDLGVQGVVAAMSDSIHAVEVHESKHPEDLLLVKVQASLHGPVLKLSVEIDWVEANRTKPVAVPWS